MRTLGNILWHFPFLGFINAIICLLIGGVLVLTVVGSPLGLGLIQLARFLLTPFSCSMVDAKALGEKQSYLWSAFGFFVRIIYFPVGLVLSILTLVQIGALMVTVVGIPVALVLAKSLGTIFNPVNKVCLKQSEL